MIWDLMKPLLHGLPKHSFFFLSCHAASQLFWSNSISKKNKIRTGEIVNYMLYNYRTNSLKTYRDFLDMVYKDRVKFTV
jgi:hypothetical protein